MEENFYEQERRMEQQGMTRPGAQEGAVEGRALDSTMTLSRYTAKTFGLMFLGLLVTFGVAFFIAYTWPGFYFIRDTLRLTGGYLHWILLIGQLLLVVGISSALRSDGVPAGRALVFFLLDCAVMGLVCGTWLLLYELESVVLVFAAAALYFGGMAVFGFVTNMDLSRLRNLLLAGLIFLIIANVAMWFIPAVGVTEQVVCTIGVVVFLGYTAYDTQMIRRLYDAFQGDEEMLRKGSIFAALNLCLDFVNLFIYLLRILGRSIKN